MAADGQRTPHLLLSDIGHDELHRVAFATLHMGVWKYDLLHQKMSWDAEVESIIGVRPSSSAEETFFGLVHPDDRPHLMAEFQKCLHERQPFSLDYRITQVDGSVVWLHSTGQPYFDEAGRPTHIVGSVFNITQQKFAQQSLQAQNDVLRSIAVGMPTEQVFQSIVDMLRDGLDVAMVALLKLNGNGRLQLAAGVNVPKTYVEIIHSLNLDDSSCMCALSVLAAEPMFCNELTSDLRLQQFREVVNQHGWGSCCTYPIMSPPNGDRSDQLLDCGHEQTAKPGVVGLFAIFRSQLTPPTESELERISQAAHLANIVIARDQTHQSLLEKEHQFRELANAMPQLVWTTDLEGKCVYGNRLLKETIGAHSLENWGAAIHPDDLDRVMQRYAESYRTGQPYTAEHRIFVQGLQAYRWFLARAIPSRDASGQIEMWYGAATDIDDLKRIEAALRDERDRLTAIAAACPSVLFTYMVAPDGTHTLPYAAPAIADLFGLPLEVLKADITRVVDRIESQDVQRLGEMLSAAAERMTPLETTFQMHHPTKGSVWVECQASPCRLADGSVCWHGTLTDITRRKLLEARLLQSEKLEAIGRLAGGVAHDFNNMLTVIISACSVLEAELRKETSQLENVQAIRDAALRAAALTKQLLAFSRQQPAAPQQLNLNAVISQTEGILARLVGSSVALQTELADDLKLVFVDPSQVEQILVNLVVNSRDAIDQTGCIRISTHNANRDKPYVEVCIADDGCGMPVETLRHIYEPFFTTKPIGKGTGLGLAVVHGIVTQNNGLIEVESRVGEGTIFRILLPAVELVVMSDSKTRKTGPLVGGNEGVLVVDDEPAIGMTTAKTLRSLGYSVFIAASPEQAQKTFENNQDQIDVLLTDLLMPGCSGLELADRLSARKKKLSVVIMSGHRTSSFDHADVARTGYRFLPKPYTTLELSSALRAAMEVN